MSADRFTIQEERRQELFSKSTVYLRIWTLLDEFCEASLANHKEWHAAAMKNEVPFEERTDHFSAKGARIHQYFISEILKAAQE